jgi:hypothetical protein
MTNEQRIRGADRSIDSAIIVTGYDRSPVTDCTNRLCAAGQLSGQGAREVRYATYSSSYSLASAEIAA